MGLVLGVLAGVFILGAFSKKADSKGAYAGFIASAIVVVYLKYFVPEVTYWAYSLITIAICVVVGLIVSKFTNKDGKEAKSETTVFYGKN